MGGAVYLTEGSGTEWVEQFTLQRGLGTEWSEQFSRQRGPGTGWLGALLVHVDVVCIHKV